MRNVGLFVAGCMVSGLIVFMGCSGNGGGSTGTGGKTTGSTGTQSTGSTSSGHGGSTTASSSGTGGGCGTGGGDGGVMLTGNKCNPVTNMGCMTGSSCDYDVDMCTMSLTTGFSCTSMAAVAICGDCSNGEVCGPGTTCFFTDASNTTAVCAHYCCTDADCGSSGKCDTGGMMPYFAPDAPTLGICVLSSPPADAGATGPYVCNPPSSPPSNGSCVTVM